jgi:hypothetical protein
LQFVLVTLYENFHQIINLVEEDIKKAVKNSSTFEQDRKHFYIGIVYHMVCSPIFEELYDKYENIEALMSLLNLFDIECESRAFVLIKSQYMQVLEKILSEQKISEKLQEQYCNNLLPFLVGKILKSSQNDVRFCCMKYLLYLVNTYMSEETLYDSSILTSTTGKITALINDHLIPQLDYLLTHQQEEAVASMTLKLIAVLFQISRVFIKQFCDTCQVASITRYYNEYSSVNVLNAIQLLVRSGYLAEVELQSVFPITHKILKHYIESSQEIYLEYPLDILKNLASICPEQQVDSIWETVIDLQSHEDIVIR